MRAKSLQSCLTLCNPMDYSLPGSSVHGHSPGKNIGVGCQSFLQGIFLTLGSNLPSLMSPALAGRFFTTSRHLGSPILWHPDTKTRQRHHKKIIINTVYEYKCKNLQQNTGKSNTIVYKKRIAHNDPVRFILAIQVWWNMTTKVIHNVKN